MSDGVEIQDLCKFYGSVVALDHASLSIREGEFVTLLGPSGSGKTTLLQLLAGLTQPSKGDIRIRGKSIISLPIEKRGLGLVFQNYALFPHMTVAGNVGYPLRMRGVARDEIYDRVAKALKLVELERFANRKPNEISGGQAQRTAIARALVFEPSVMLLDEPLSALDRRLREHMKYELRRLHDLIGTTTIFVTHDQDEALALSDRIAVLDGGKLQQFGTADEVYRHPRTRFVAQFMGETNLIEATVVRDADGAAAVDVAGRRIDLGEVDTKGLEAGMKIAIGLRAEQLAVAPKTAASGVWTATVTSMFYLGNGYRYLLDCAPHQLTVHVAAPHADTSIRSNDQVEVRWQPASVQILPG